MANEVIALKNRELAQLTSNNALLTETVYKQDLLDRSPLDGFVEYAENLGALDDYRRRRLAPWVNALLETPGQFHWPLWGPYWAGLRGLGEWPPSAVILSTLIHTYLRIIPLMSPESASVVFNYMSGACVLVRLWSCGVEPLANHVLDRGTRGSFAQLVARLETNRSEELTNALEQTLNALERTGAFPPTPPIPPNPEDAARLVDPLHLARRMGTLAKNPKLAEYDKSTEAERAVALEDAERAAAELPGGASALRAHREWREKLEGRDDTQEPATAAALEDGRCSIM